MKNYKVIVNGTAYEVAVEEISAADVKTVEAAPALDDVVAAVKEKEYNHHQFQ